MMLYKILNAVTTEEKQRTRAAIFSCLLLFLIALGLSLLLHYKLVENRNLKEIVLHYDGYEKFGIISDIHLTFRKNDSLYCEKQPNNFNSSYGYDNCDTNLNFSEIAVRSIADTLRNSGSPQFVLLLGDSNDHRYDEEIRKPSIETLTEITSLFIKYIPDIPKYPVIGNDDYPEANYQEPAQNPEVFYKAVWTQFARLINGSSVNPDSFYRGGYYAVKHSDDLWIIALNTVLFSYHCNITRSKQDAQLLWLSQSLKRIRLLKAEVLIIGHIPPGLNSYSVTHGQTSRTLNWPDDLITSFEKTVTMFSNIIRGIYFGHDHEFSWFAHGTKKEKIWSYFSLSSISPIYSNTPTYHVVIKSPTSWYPIDIQIFSCNLDFFIRTNKIPIFQFYTSLKQMYFRIPMLHEKDIIDPAFLARLTYKMASLENLLEVYATYVLSLYQLKSFSGISVYQAMCAMTSTTVDDAEQCLTTFSYESIFPSF